MTKYLLVAAAAWGLLPLTPLDAQPATSHSAPSVASAPRQTVPLTDGWRFRQAAAPGAIAADFDDARWQQVTLPHTWNRVGLYEAAAGVGVNTPDTINPAQGQGWYRLRFAAPFLAHGKRAWLEFDAASRTAEVWLNGVRLGRHDGGFARFRFDATAALRAGQANLLVVKTDNSPPVAGSPTANTFPLMGDFFVYGGLYRPARLVVTGQTHFDMLDHGGAGVYARTAEISQGAAQIAVTGHVVTHAHRRVPVTVSAALIDTHGAIASRAVSHISVIDGAAGTVRLALAVPRAHLWNGTRDPYLYRLRVDIRDSRGRVLDRYEQPFGIRQIRLDPDKGFFLNGESLRLHGVGLHQDREGKGWAQTDTDIEASMRTIREMGANTVRLTHYQHGETVHDIADRLGLILWDEISVVSAWTSGPGQTAAPAELAANADQQLRELIRQNYNHPSVAVWSIANEVDFGPNRPDFIGAPPSTVPDPRPLLERLNRLAKQEDPHRPTVLATCCEDNRMDGVPIVADITDAAGANRYPGWYYASPQAMGPILDGLHRKRPAQPLALSEYGAGGAFSIHTDDPRGGPIDAGGRQQPEEYQAFVHEQTWPQLKARPYLWATWLWNSFDFSTYARKEGDTAEINTKGLVSYDGRTRKDAYYFYKANWSDAPTVRITGRRYADRAYPVTDVRVYSNAGSTALSLNGAPLGTRSDCPDRICVWPAVRLAEGHNELVAAGNFATGATTDRVAWALAAGTGRTFRIDAGAIVAAPASAGRFGSDAFFAGGSVGTTDHRTRPRGPLVPAVISGSPDRELLASFREGRFAYHIPAAPGRYRVTLSLVEPGAGNGERVFKVMAGGREAVPPLDLAALGAALTAVTRSFEATADVNGITLEFVPITGQAIVSAIEVVPVSAAR